jgi:hypothetical protein
VLKAAKKEAILGGNLAPLRGAFPNEPFPCCQIVFLEQPAAVKGAPLLGAAERTLGDEDCSQALAQQGKGGSDYQKMAPPKWPHLKPPKHLLKGTTKSGSNENKTYDPFEAWR